MRRLALALLELRLAADLRSAESRHLHVESLAEDGHDAMPVLAERDDYVQCECTTPKEGTVGKNGYRCSDRAEAFCDSHMECFKTEPFRKGDAERACRVPHDPAWDGEAWYEAPGTAAYCDKKYPALKTMRSSERVFFTAILKDAEKVLPLWTEELKRVVNLTAGSFVSIIEGGSTDRTKGMLEDLGKQLRAAGVPHAISMNESIIAGPTFKPDSPSTGNRITYLAKLRNAALWPLVEQRAAKSRPGRVVFLNDVLFCAGDVLRLLELTDAGADMSCGYDFADQDKLGPYDRWVLDYGGASDADYSGTGGPAVLQESTDPDGMRYSRPEAHECVLYGAGAPAPCATEAPIQVFSCWGGLAAARAEPIYKGVRFRDGLKDGECAQSECSLFAMDLHRLGHQKIVLDPSVQTFYDNGAMKRFFRLSRPDTQGGTSRLPSFRPAARTYRCCPLPHPGTKYTSWGDCHSKEWQDCHPNSGTATCLGYHAKDWDEPWGPLHSRPAADHRDGSGFRKLAKKAAAPKAKAVRGPVATHQRDPDAGGKP